MARHILRDNAKAYDKGVLAEILEPIMGKGLIPADPETWNVRRRAIVPGFHKAWLNAMVRPVMDLLPASITSLGHKVYASGRSRVLIGDAVLKKYVNTPAVWHHGLFRNKNHLTACVDRQTSRQREGKRERE